MQDYVAFTVCYMAVCYMDSVALLLLRLSKKYIYAALVPYVPTNSPTHFQYPMLEYIPEVEEFQDIHEAEEQIGQSFSKK